MKHIDITIRLALDVDEVTDEHRRALDALANVMLVQAEDGLYSAGYKESDGTYGLVDGKWVDQENIHLAGISASSVWMIDEPEGV